MENTTNISFKYFDQSLVQRVIDFTERDGYVYPKLLQLSNDSHLYHEGILTGYQNEIRF